MRTAIYSRVSTPDQSMERQGRELRAYAKARDWKIICEIKEVASGGAKRRPQREVILNLARRREIDTILVQALDRWGRSVQDLVLTMAELESLGVAFVVPGQIDMTSPTGRMLAHFLSAVAEFERELIRERVRSGLANAKAKGKQLGRPRIPLYQLEQGLLLLNKGMTFQKVARKTGLSVSTLLRARRTARRA